MYIFSPRSLLKPTQGKEAGPGYVHVAADASVIIFSRIVADTICWSTMLNIALMSMCANYIPTALNNPSLETKSQDFYTMVT